MNKIILGLIYLILFPIGLDAQSVVSEFKIEGNKKIKSSFIKKISKVKEGIVLDSSFIKEDISRLKRLAPVSNANYKVIPSKNNYIVHYIIEENFTIIPYVNIYTSNNDGVAYKIGLYEFNLLGRNISLGGYYQKDVYNSYGINFRAPFLFSKCLGLVFNHQNLTTFEPVFFNNSTVNYRYNNKSFEVLGLYQIDAKNRLELGINYFVEKYNHESGMIGASIPQNLDINKLLYKTIYEYNNIDYHYQYISGIKSTFVFQFVNALKEKLPEFVIGWNDFNHYVRVGKKGNWASRLRIGFSSNIESPFAPFIVDNNLNIRGVGNIVDRGTGNIVINTEYRHTLLEKKWFVLQSNLFTDAGTWRNPGGGFNDFVKSENIRIYPGFGLRFMHKLIYNAIFRVDYGIGITKRASKGIVFGIGQYF